MPVFNNEIYTLEEWSLYRLAEHCVHLRVSAEYHPKEQRTVIINKVKNTVHNIHKMFANKFVEIVIVLLAETKRMNYLTFADLIHPDCSTIVINHQFAECANAIINVALSRKTMKSIKLLNKHYNTDDCIFCSIPTTDDRYDAFFPFLLEESITVSCSFLTVLELPRICTASIIQAISTACPKLRILDIRNSIRLIQGDIRCLDKCQNLSQLIIVTDDRTATPGFNSLCKELATDIAYLLMHIKSLRSLGPLFDPILVLGHLKLGDSFLIESVTLGPYYHLHIAKLPSAVFPNLIALHSCMPLDSEILNEFKELGKLRAVGFCKEEYTDIVNFYKNNSEHQLKAKFKFIERVTEVFVQTEFPQLNCLSFWFCDGIDIEVISKSAQSLNSLIFVDCNLAPLRRQINYGFPKLSNLVFKRINSYENLRYILKSCKSIKSLTIDSYSWGYIHNESHHITEKQFIQLSEMNGFRELEVLHIYTMIDDFNTATFNYLMENFPSLTYVKFKSQTLYKLATEGNDDTPGTVFVDRLRRYKWKFIIQHPKEYKDVFISVSNMQSIEENRVDSFITNLNNMYH